MALTDLIPKLIPENLIGRPSNGDSFDDISVADFLRGAAAAPILGIDTETNGQDIRDGRGFCMGISLAYEHRPGVYACAYFPFRHLFGANYTHEILEEVKKLIEFKSRFHLVLFHNAKFDMVSLSTIGINIGPNYMCTMLMSHLVNENLYSQSLNGVASFYLGKDCSKQKTPDMDAIIKTMGWGHIPSEMMNIYAYVDAALLPLIYAKMLPMFTKEKLDAYWPYKQKTIEVVQAMESRGVRVDVPFCDTEIACGEMAMADVVEILGCNPGSGKDLAKLLLQDLELPVVGKTKTGNPSFDKDAMEIYDQILERSGSAVANYILTYRGWQKTVSSNYRAYKELLSPDGRLRPNYKLHGTKTGRFSCEKPNLQQIPREGSKPWNGGTKRAFIPKDGYVLIEADYSQLELRLATGFANEESLLRVFTDGRDIFTEMATRLGLSRQDTKTFVYSVQYGAGNTRISHVFGVDTLAAQAMRNDYYYQYPGFRSINNMAMQAAKKNSKVKIWTGRFRHFQYPDSEAHKALNAAIQGGAADVVERAMHRLYDTVDNDECRMLLQVHDSVIFEVRKDRVGYYSPIIQSVMEDIDPNWGVKFAADVHPLWK